MSDKSLVIALPEDLIQRAVAARIDIRATLERALVAELSRATAADIEIQQWGMQPLTLAQKEQRLRDLLPPDRVEGVVRLLHAGHPIPGLYAGSVWVSEDFDAPLAEDTWGDAFA